MAVELLLLPTATLMLMLLLFVGTGFGGMPTLESTGSLRRPTAAKEAELETIRGTIEMVNQSDRTIMLVGDLDMQVYEISSTATVIKDGQRVKLESLARGDSAILFIREPGRGEVTRIQAATRW